MSKQIKIFLALFLLIVIIMLGSVYTINQTEQAIVLQFGNPITQVKEPGLHFKYPFFLQNVVKFDKRILDLSVGQNEVVSTDQKRMIVDAFAKYRIVDQLKFYQAVRNEAGIQNRLTPILNSRLQEVLSKVPFSTLLSGERSKIMKQVKDYLNAAADNFGVEIVDVRIKRTDLPEKNSQSIFDRMKAERKKEATLLRAQGEQESTIIKAKAEREKVEILAEAQKKSQILRGEGDAQAAKIFADAFGRDPDFFLFYRSMQAYKESFNINDTTMILSPESDFLRYFEGSRGNLKD